MARIAIAIMFISSLVLTAGCGDGMIGKPAPDFSVVDLRGNEISLSDYRGKVVLIDFWATWCPPCVEEAPNVKRVYDKYKDEGFVVIGISVDNNRSALEAFIEKEGIEWPQVFDATGENKIATLYKANMIPAMFLVGKDGILRETNARGDRLEPGVRKLLSLSATSEG